MARKRLSKTEIELLTDYIVEATNDPRVTEAFLLLFDYIDRLSLKRPMDIESVCVYATERAYYRLMMCYTRKHKGDLPDLIDQLHREFKWKGKL